MHRIHKQIIIDKLTKALEALTYIHAFWLEGADATGTDDVYSDLDFWVDVDDAFLVKSYEVIEHTLNEISPINYRYIMNHNHPKIRQRIYHLENTGEYLMIDFCWQLHSRPRDEYIYIENDTIETAKVIFDKSNIIRFKPMNPSDYIASNQALLREAKYRRTQHVRAMKYVKRGQLLEAQAYYHRYVVTPLVDLLRLIYTPAHADFSVVHISQHIPAAEREQLEYFVKICSLEDIERKIPEAAAWFDMLERYLTEKINRGCAL